MHGNTFRPSDPSATGLRGAHIERPDERCFADEVVVDFPSVVPAVSRMWRGFVEPDRAVEITIQVAARDAFRGARVSFDAPVRRLCRACGGRGESWAEACVTCAGGGTEVIECPVTVALPRGVRDGACLGFTVSPRHEPPTRVELRVSVT